MLGIIIWIIIIYYIFKKVKNEQGQNSNPQRTNTQSTISKNRTPVVPAQTNKNFAEMPVQKKTPPNVERKCAAEDGHRSENNVYHKNNSQQAAVPNVQREYTQAPKQTRTEKKATRMVAKRLYEGDHVPKGYRMVKCGYCAAENLISLASRGAYMCYFCHEDL